MKILIVEDEKPAREIVKFLVSKYIENGEIIAECSSIDEAVEFLKNNSVDLIFLDVELSDGISFDIFNDIKIDVPIIVTTAYDQYAIRAFKVGSVDYLLKPIDHKEFKLAVERAQKQMSRKDGLQVDFQEIAKILKGGRNAKERFTVKIGDKIKIVDVGDIAYFFSEDKFTFIVSRQGQRHLIDQTLDYVEQVVDNRLFFRLSRGCIIRLESIRSVVKYFNGRLKVDLTPDTIFPDGVVVSRQRVHSFMEWLEGENN